jgi:hypothetical protein
LAAKQLPVLKEPTSRPSVITTTLKTKAALLLGDFKTKWPKSSSQSLSGSLPEDYLLKRFDRLADTNL